MSLISIARNKNADDLLAVLSSIAHRITSDDWAVYAKQAEFERLWQGRKTDAALVTYSLLKPSLFDGFASVTIASACMTETTLFRLWSAMGVKLKPVSAALRKDLRYTEHEHGDRITIYFASHEAWSKRYRDRVVKDAAGREKRVLEQVRQAVVALIGAEPFVWMGNKDLADDFFGPAGAERLPNTPHGLNSFQGFHNVVVLSALNPPPAHFHFMEAQGVCGEELRIGCYRTAVYQAVMRCSIRNPADATPKRVVVMDRDTAEWLAALFPGATVVPLPGLGALPSKGKAGRPRRHADDAGRTRAYRFAQRRGLLEQLDQINGTSLADVSYRHFVRPAEEEASACDEIPLKERDSVTAESHSTPAVTCGTAYLSIYDRIPFDHFEHEGDDAFIAGLRDLHDRQVPKEQAGLFGPAHFDPGKTTDTDRGLDNITHLRGIWLDNDGGDLTHAAFADLFPYLRVVVWNTASSTAAAPRWRAFIPTSDAFSLDIQALIMTQFVKVLNRAGYWGKRQIEKLARRRSVEPRLRHGFDESKFNAASLFYLPVQAKDPADSFFIDYGMDDPKRGPLDLRAWIDHCILDLRPQPRKASPVPGPAAEPIATEKRRVSTKLQATRDAIAARDARSGADRRAIIVEKAIDEWRSTPRGSGHTAFFRLAASLHRAGLDLSEIREKLWEEAAYGYSARERRGEIGETLKSLSRRGTLAGSSGKAWWN